MTTLQRRGMRFGEIRETAREEKDLLWYLCMRSPQHQQRGAHFSVTYVLPHRALF